MATDETKNVLQEENELKPMSKWEIFKEEICHFRMRCLLVIIWLQGGLQYINDFPGSIGTGVQDTIQSDFNKQGKRYTQAMNQALYSVTSYPNIVMCIVGGILADKYLGLRLTTLIAAILIFISSIFFWLGVVYTNYPVIVVGRLFLGISMETMSVAESNTIARWFLGSRSMAFAYCSSISISRALTAVNFQVSPRIASSRGPASAAFGGLIITFVSVIAAVAMWILDIIAVKRKILSPQNVGGNAVRIPKFKEMIKQPPELWILALICIFSYGALAPFIGIARNYFEVRDNLDGKTAASYTSIYSFMAIGICLISSFVIDRVGRYAYWLLSTGILMLIVHLLLLVSPIHPIAVMVMVGVFFSTLISGLWPAVPIVVQENVIAVSYALMFSIQSIFLATLPLITGAVLTAYTPETPPGETTPLPKLKGYRICSVIFIICGFVAICLSILLIFINRSRSKSLICSATKMREYVKERREKWENVYATNDETDLKPANTDANTADNSSEDRTKNEDKTENKEDQHNG